MVNEGLSEGQVTPSESPYGHLEDDQQQCENLL